MSRINSGKGSLSGLAQDFKVRSEQGPVHWKNDFFVELRQNILWSVNSESVGGFTIQSGNF